MASVRSCPTLRLRLTEPMPAGSRTDPLLAKAEPISDSGSTSVITYLRRQKPQHNSIFAAREGSENSADPKVSAEGGQEVLQVPEQRFPCSP